MFGAEGGAGSSGQPVCRPCVTSPRYCAVTRLHPGVGAVSVGLIRFTQLLPIFERHGASLGHSFLRGVLGERPQLQVRSGRCCGADITGPLPLDSP